jgi:endonuclease/exonuclease/phosphatase family metal-dependent hydrolase
VAAVVVLTLAGGARTIDHRHVYLQFNLCGNACSGGALGVVSELVGWINQRRPFAVTLNEVCENQYARLRADLVAYDGRFDATGARCRNGARYGNAVLVRASVDLVGSWELPNPSRDEPRRLMCLSTRTALVVCVVHISNHAGNIAAQVNAVAGHVGPLAADRATLLGGDFNTNPADPRLDPMYGTCERTGFLEVDASGCGSRPLLDHAIDGDVINQDTYRQHKYDYIFLSYGDWASPEADAADANGFSDHDALWATAVPKAHDHEVMDIN